MTELHASIRDKPMPAKMRALPILESGWPQLFFAATVNGKVDLRIGDRKKWWLCVKQRRCWLCGQQLGRYLAWPIGPMCVVNRVSAEPPSHFECAEYSVKVCPFLTRPHMRRNDTNKPDGYGSAGIMEPRNPGASALWVSESYELIKDQRGDALIKIGPHTQVTWWAEGRTATVQEVLDSINSGLPKLVALAELDGPEAVKELREMTNIALTLVK